MTHPTTLVSGKKLSQLSNDSNKASKTNPSNKAQAFSSKQNKPESQSITKEKIERFRIIWRELGNIAGGHLSQRSLTQRLSEITKVLNYQPIRQTGNRTVFKSVDTNQIISISSRTKAGGPILASTVNKIKDSVGSQIEELEQLVDTRPVTPENQSKPDNRAAKDKLNLLKPDDKAMATAKNVNLKMTPLPDKPVPDQPSADPSNPLVMDEPLLPVETGKKIVEAEEL